MSQVPEVLDALYNLWRFDPALEDVRVTDGALVTESKAPDWVCVGYDADAGGDFRAASSQQDWADMGTSRAEQIELTVAVVARRGDTDVRAARVRVYAMADVLQESLRQNPSAGLPQMQIGIAAGALHQEQTGDGIEARLVLTLTCNTFA